MELTFTSKTESACKDFLKIAYKDKVYMSEEFSKDKENFNLLHG